MESDENVEDGEVSGDSGKGCVTDTMIRTIMGTGSIQNSSKVRSMCEGS